jgi:hypothetical protein
MDSGKVGCTYVVTGEMVDVGLGQHGVVFEFTFPERRGIASNDNELGLSGSKCFQGRLIAKGDYEWNVSENSKVLAHIR